MTLTVFSAPVSPNDLETIIRIEHASFTHPWQRQAIVDELACPDAFQFVAKVAPLPCSQATAVGFIFVRLLTDEMHIMKIAVEPQWRNRGAARTLLLAAQTEAMRRGSVTALLEVRSSNNAAVRFYAKSGYQRIGIRPNYYPPAGETALVMSKSLKEEP